MVDNQQYLDWLALKQQKTPLGDGPSDIPRQGVTFELKPTPLDECLILASSKDNLGALIKSRSLSEISQGDFELITDASRMAKDFDEYVISFGVMGSKKIALRRKQRDAARRLLIALLVKHADYHPIDLKGTKIKTLINLANAKIKLLPIGDKS